MASYDPSLMVPPRSSFLDLFSVVLSEVVHSVMRPTIELLQLENSLEFASCMPNIFLAISITASCIPKHIPKYGILFSLAYLIAAIFPSEPRSPNPPGTKMP